MKTTLTRILLAIAFMLSATVSLFAHDFEAINDDGVTIYYNKLSDFECEVTYYDDVYNSAEYSGSITIPAFVTYVGSAYTVTSIGHGAFNECTSLTSVTLPRFLTFIDGEAFCGCTSLTSLTILATNPPSVITYPFIFEDVPLSSATLYVPSGCHDIYEAFWDYSEYFGTILELDPEPIPDYFIVPNPDGVIIRYHKLSDTECEVTALEDDAKYSGSITIPAKVSIAAGTTYSVTTIGNWAFHDCTSLSSLSLPKSLTAIGEEAFGFCYSLSSLSLENTFLSTIGIAAFKDCASLTSLTLPNTITSIGDYAFYDSPALTSLTVLATTPPYIGCDAFECPLSTPTLYNATLYVPSGTLAAYQTAKVWRDFSSIVELDPVPVPDFFTVPTPDGIIIRYHKLSDTECEVTSLENNDKYSGDITVPASVNYVGNTLSVTSVRDYAFMFCSSLTSISLPNSLSSIGNQAFFSCTSLSTISLPGSLTAIGYLAFDNCTALTSISLPNNLTSIGDHAFHHCTSLSSISLPSSLTSIGNSPFVACTSLSSISVDPSNPNYSSQDGILFSKDQSTLICYPSDKQGSNTYIVPNTVTSIVDQAFYNCTFLTSITLPSSLTSIGYDTFGYCSSLTSVTVLATTPPTVGSIAFDKVPLSDATLYVPYGSLAAYQTAEGWCDFGTIIELDPDHLPCSLPSLTFSEGTLTFTCETPGAICHYAFTSSEAPADAPLSALNIEIYATAEGYDPSEKVTINLLDLLQAAASRDFNGDGHLSAADVAILVQQVLQANTPQ